jgi:predicted NBD/HSP70 family sugar kinase
MIYIPSRMGQLNRRVLLRQLQKLGMASRADLAKSIGMSQPTAGKIVDELLESDVLEEVDAAEAALGAETVLRGRPGRLLRLNCSSPQLLGIQLGVNETMVAELSLGGLDRDEWHFNFGLDHAQAQPARGWEAQLAKVARSMRDKTFLGTLLSVPGVVDETANRVLFSPNLHWTEKADLVALVQRVWPGPVLLVQEERVLALGHHLTHPDCEDFLLVDFGEGVGGAIVVNGKPLANPLPISGELGHTPALGNQRRCGCGAVGCLETLVSVRGLLESFAVAHPEVPANWVALSELVARQGIEPWLALALDAAAVAIAGALNVLGLRMVVITGSLAELPPAVMEYLSRAIENGAMWARFGKVECVSAPRRRTAGLVAVGIDRLVVPDRPEKEAWTTPKPKISRGKLSPEKASRNQISRGKASALKVVN